MIHKQSFIFSTARTVMLFLLFGGFLTACLPAAPSSRGGRKKMLTLDGADVNWEGFSLSTSGAKTGSGKPGVAGFPTLPFAVSDTLLQQGGSLHPYVLLRLPAADYDFLLIGANTYEAWFPGWLKSWSQTGREGLVIDLSAGKATGQGAFRLTAPGLDNPVPLMLLWDDAGEKRAAFYTGVLQSFTAIQCENLGSGKCN